MKNYKMTLASILLLSVSIGSLFSCKKSFYGNAEYESLDSTHAYIKIVHVSPNFSKIFATPDDSVQVSLDESILNTTPISFTGTSTTVSGYKTQFNGMYPYAVSLNATTNANTYAMVAPGAKTVNLLNHGTNLYHFAANLKGGSYYTLFITDSIKSSNDSARIFVQDNWNRFNSNPLDGYFNIRFMNAVMQDSSTIAANSTVDVYSYARNSVIFSKIRPDSLSSFTQVGFNMSAPDTFYVTRTPTQTGTVLLANRIVLAKLVIPAQSASVPGYTTNRSFTLMYTGDGTLTSGTTARNFSWYINY